MRATPKKRRLKRLTRTRRSTAQYRLNQLLSGRSKRAIARKLGASPSHINRVLNGQRDCSIPMAKRLAAELGLDLATFLEATAPER